MDPRTQRTHQQLRAALLELLRTKPLEAITVRELTDQAKLNRSTFYLHYTNVTQIVSDVEDELFEHYQTYLADYTRNLGQTAGVEGMGYAPATRILLNQTFEFLLKYLDWAPLILSKTRSSRLLRMLLSSGEAIFLRDSQSKLNAWPQDVLVDYFRFIVSGSIGVIETWLKEGAQTSPSAMADRLSHFIISSRPQ